MTPMQQIQHHLGKIDKGYTLELYTNSLNDAVLISISPSIIEQHLTIDITDISIA
jgi:hypothetical protein